MLEIHTQPGRIEVTTKKARAPMRTGLAALRLDIAPPRLTLSTKQARVLLDAGASWAYSGLARPSELGLVVREQSYQDALAAIGEIAEEGDRLAAFWLPGNTIPDVAAEKPAPRSPFTYGVPPLKPVQTSVIPGSVRAEFTPGHVAAYLEPRTAETPYEPGAVRIYQRQYPAIDIRARWVDVAV